MKTKKRKPPGVNPWGDDAQSHPPLSADELGVLARLRAGESLAIAGQKVDQ